MAQLKITLLKSMSGAKEPQIKTCEALGLHKIGHKVLHQDNDAIRGMINRVSHLVAVEEVEGDA